MPANLANCPDKIECFCALSFPSAKHFLVVQGRVILKIIHSLYTLESSTSKACTTWLKPCLYPETFDH